MITAQDSASPGRRKGCATAPRLRLGPVPMDTDMIQLARDTTVISELTARFQAYFVQLSLVGILDGEANHFPFSGFLLRYKQREFWCTAGHVFDAVETVRREVPDVQARWVDGYGHGAAAAIPLSLHELPTLRLNQNGLDFGAVPLRRDEVCLISADAGKLFLDDNSWKRPSGWYPDGFVIAGVPSCRTRIRPTGADDAHLHFEVDSDFGLLCAKVIDEHDERRDSTSPFWASPLAWYGELVDFRQLRQGGHLSTIKGMSGSPVFGVRCEPNGYSYQLIGIQSEWLPDSCIVRATAIEALLAGLESALTAGKEG